MSSVIEYQSLGGILNREDAVSSVKELTDKYSPYLQELVNYSTQLLARCEKSLRDVKGTPTSLINLYYHAIRVTDGIEVLAANACCAAAAPLHRSLLETSLSIEYMLENDFNVRSTAWMVASFLQQRRFLESLDYSSKRGQQLLNMIAVDKVIGPRFSFHADSNQLEEQLRRIDQQLKKPKFAPVVEQLQGKERIKKWYEINDGPSDLYKLARLLGRPLEYELSYRRDSEILHACDSESLLSQVDGVLVINPVRPGSSEIESLYRTSGAMLILSSVSVAYKLRPEEAVKEQLRSIILKHIPDVSEYET
jgi:hypothetical protein